MAGFLELLRVQRWDDHRFYHHSRINQSLHLLSAVSFLCAYWFIFTDTALAGLIGWLVAMTSRQMGHFFFEPKGYDAVNQVTHEYKEEVKVGYNLQRKVVLMSLWAFSPVFLLIDPTLLGLMTPAATTVDFIRHVGYMWFGMGVAGLLFRSVQLCIIRNVQTGVVWAVKILTDPFEDIMLYYKSPILLFRDGIFDSTMAAHFTREETEAGH